MTDLPEDYNISFSAEYPDTWRFDCCGDMDVGSWHAFFPAGTPPLENGKLPPGTPFIRILDHAMAACPAGKGLYDCSIDEIAPVSPQEFRRRYLEDFDSRPGLKKKGETHAKHFTDTVAVYEGTDEHGLPTDVYVLSSAHGVFDVVVYEPEGFDPAFISEFLDRLMPKAR